MIEHTVSDTVNTWVKVVTGHLTLMVAVTGALDTADVPGAGFIVMA